MTTQRWWLVAIACAVVAFAAFAVPMYVIRPFRAQGATELAVALIVKRWGPPLAVAAWFTMCAAAIALWRARRRWTARTGVALVALCTTLFAVLSHVNVYELMFHPAGAPRFVAAALSGIDKDDMVMAVALNGDARAYPIRTMGYHHIVNDVVGGVPITATY